MSVYGTVPKGEACQIGLAWSLHGTTWICKWICWSHSQLLRVHSLPSRPTTVLMASRPFGVPTSLTFSYNLTKIVKYIHIGQRALSQDYLTLDHPPFVMQQSRLEWERMPSQARLAALTKPHPRMLKFTTRRDGRLLTWQFSWIQGHYPVFLLGNAVVSPRRKSHGIGSDLRSEQWRD
jgi:hypothetical protein